MVKKKLERAIEFTLISGLAFVIGILVTFYKLDHRLWNEDINRANDIETRYMNYPTQKCYDTSDLNRIIYGK